MKLKCTAVISDYNDAFEKGAEYKVELMKDGQALIHGNREKLRSGGFWAIKSLDSWVILGIAKFKEV